MDRKYGRLFTEEDVRKLIGTDTLGVTEQVLTERLAEVGDDALTFPTDEPLFLLRGQDKAALEALVGGQDYEDASRYVGASTKHLEAIQAAADAIFAWQRANPDRVKVPD